MSPRSVPALSAWLLLPLLAGSPAVSQETPAPRSPEQPPARAALARPLDLDAPSTAAELARLNRTLERIADLLERQTEGQRLDLALRRLAVESERVTALDRDLQSAEETMRSLEDQRVMMRAQFESMAGSVEDLPPDASAEQLQQFERMASEAQRMMERFDRQIDDQQQRVLEIQNELTARRADLQALQDRLDRQLEGM